MSTGTRRGVMGPASFRSVAEMWRHRVESTPSATAMLYREAAPHRRDPSARPAPATRGAAHWNELTWRAADDIVRRIGCGLLDLGIVPEARVAILARTSVDWVLADLAILCCGAAATTIYPTHTPDECRFILADSGCVAAFCDDATQVRKLLSVADQLPSLHTIICFQAKLTQAPPPQEHPRVRLITLATLEERGEAWDRAHSGGWDDAWRSITPARLATLIYTSGTTGQPKGVELTHDAWVYEGEAMDALGFLTAADRQYLFLPLAHVFAQVLMLCFVRLGLTTVVDGDDHRLLEGLGETHPTWFGAVPRVFEKAHARILADVARRSAPERLAFRWAMAQRERALNGKRTLASRVADRWVLEPVRARFGGRVRLAISGGAPLDPEISRFFQILGIPILEGYGLTESSAASCVNTPEDLVIGSVGRPLPGCEVRIADDGEILMRSRGVMRGYHGLPEDTAASVTDDGWLHTGDIGEILTSGHVRITDRKKELIVTAGGKNVAPQRAERLLLQRVKLLAHVILHGDRRPYCTALAVLSPEDAGRFAQDRGIPWKNLADLAAHPEVVAAVQLGVNDVNRELPGFERIKRFAILPSELDPVAGELTPKGSVRRKVVERRWKALLDSLYPAPTARAEAREST